MRFDKLGMEDNFLNYLEAPETAFDTHVALAVIPIDMMNLELISAHLLIDLYGQTRLVAEPEYCNLQRSAAAAHDPACQISNGHQAHTLVDSGSLGDFMVSTLADQLQVHRTPLHTPLSVQLAAQGSHTKVNYGTTVHFQYQTINED